MANGVGNERIATSRPCRTRVYLFYRMVLYLVPMSKPDVSKAPKTAETDRAPTTIANKTNEELAVNLFAEPSSIGGVPSLIGSVSLSSSIGSVSLLSLSSSTHDPSGSMQSKLPQVFSVVSTQVHSQQSPPSNSHPALLLPQSQMPFAFQSASSQSKEDGEVEDTELGSVVVMTSVGSQSQPVEKNDSDTSSNTASLPLLLLSNEAPVVRQREFHIREVEYGGRR